jgi:archaemetzincin
MSVSECRTTGHWAGRGVLLLGLASLGACAVLGLHLVRAAEPAARLSASRREAPLTAEGRKAIVYAQYALSGWPKLGEPKPGEWLSFVAEPGQTYEEFVQTAHNLKSEQRHTIYILPFGRMDAPTQQVVMQLGEFARVYFACPVIVLRPVELPKASYVHRRRQYDAADVLRRMGRHVPDDALALVGVTTADLYSGDLDFVFGLAGLRSRVAILALGRYGEPGTPEFLHRAMKSLAHETGHVFGLRHCIFYSCCMNGSNSLDESDSQPIHCCPLCHDKLRHALAFDPEARFEALAAMYDRLGFESDARSVRERLAHLRGLHAATATTEGP